MGIKLKEFVIALDRHPVYTPRDLVSGFCLISLGGLMNLDQLCIKLEGYAKCLWCDSNENSISSEINLVNFQYKPGNFYPTVLTAGKHRIEFNFLLPPSLPSSFKGVYGKIKYKIKATINTPKFTFDKKHEIVISIQSLAINSNFELTQRVSCTCSKQIGLFKEKVTMTCHLQRMGFNIGTTIPIDCVTNNQSGYKYKLRASLKKKTTFYAQNQEMSTEDKFTVFEGASIRPLSKLNQVLYLPVPSTVPVLMASCQIIQIRYVVIVTMVIPGLRDIHCELPVVITHEKL